MRRLVASFLVAIAISFSAILCVRSHEHHGDSSCEMDPNVRLLAEYRQGIVTVDGHLDDWDAIDGSEFELRPALDPDEDKKYQGGKITVKAIHDGSNMYFALQVDGEYTYAKGDSTQCPSVALMFQVGENATYDSMGGCSNLPGTCTSQSCQGHEVDIMHFSIGTAIPGRLYGGNIFDNTAGNGGDRFGHLVDVYAWNPHCRYLDGVGPDVNNTNALNDWHGAWWHNSLMLHSGYVEGDSPYATQGQKGTYYFEFSRPLRTMDRFQQDVQFTIGQVSKIAVAFWYPTGGHPWSKSQHYSGSCNWIPLDIASASQASLSHSNNSSWDAMTAFSLLLSVVAFCISIFVGYWVSKRKNVPFMPIEMSPMR
ncbi:heme binding protein [Carex rostrata]